MFLNNICPSCNGNVNYKASMPIDAKSFKPLTGCNIYQCSNCLMGFVYPRHSDDEIMQLYQSFIHYTKSASHFVDAEPPNLIARIKTHLAWKLDKSETMIDQVCAYLKPNAHILVIGVAAEYLSQHLFDKGFHVSSLNVNNPLGSSFLSGLTNTITFDALVVTNIVEHVANPLSNLQEMTKVLKKEGKLFLKVPNYQSASAQQSGLAWEHLDAPRRVNYFTEKSITSMLNNAGFNIDKFCFEGFCGYFDASYIATEQRIYDQLARVENAPFFAKRNSEFRSWLLLAKTAFAEKHKKYDAIGVMASLAKSK